MLGKPLTSPVRSPSSRRATTRASTGTSSWPRSSATCAGVRKPSRWSRRYGFERTGWTYLIHFPELLRHESYVPEWILGALFAAGVTYGVDEEAIDSLCADWPAATEAGAALVAAGSDPVDGTDTHVDFTSDPSKRAGAVRADVYLEFGAR